MRHVPFALALLAPFALPVAADASTVRSSNVYGTGSGRFNCTVVRVVQGFPDAGIECSADAVPRLPGGDGDPYVALRATGRSKLGARGDYPGYSTKRRKLRVGDVWRPGHSATGIVCGIRSLGLGCTNRSGHGFVITADDVVRF